MDDAGTAHNANGELGEGTLCRAPNRAVKHETAPQKTAQQKVCRNQDKMGELGSSSEEIEVDFKEGQESAADGEVKMPVKDELDELLGLQVQFGESPHSPRV